MQSTRDLCVAIAMLALMAAAAGRASASSGERQPNIVVLLADDLGYGELGCQGNRQVPTPHIDSLARSGVRFTSGYVTASYCSPSRAGLLTGRTPARFGYEGNPVGARNEDPRVGVPPGVRTLPDFLHARGYTTALIGKWHLGGAAPHHPLRRGFDEFFGFLHEGHFYVPPPWRGVTTMLRRKTLPGGGEGRAMDGKLVFTTHMRHDEPPYDANNPIQRGGQPVVEGEYLTDAFTREAVDFIDRHKTRPFFLYLAYNAVHSPLQGADKYMARVAHIADIHRRIFAAMLVSLDDSVGKVLAKLRDEGLEEHTLIFFLSDNGGPTRELTSSNLPLRGGKGDVYEGGIRVPFVVSWKGTVRGGGTYEAPVTSMDIFATAASAAGLPVPEGIDGVDLRPYVTGEVEGVPHAVLYWRQGPRTALRAGNWKLLCQGRRGGTPRWELYNLDEDASEATDLSTAEPAKLRELDALWQRLDGEMADPLF